MDGTSKKALTANNIVDGFNISTSSIYYKYNTKIYSMKLDGTNKRTLSKFRGSSNAINLTKDYIINYKNKPEEGNLIKTKILPW